MNIKIIDIINIVQGFVQIKKNVKKKQEKKLVKN